VVNAQEKVAKEIFDAEEKGIFFLDETAQVRIDDENEA